MREPKLVDDVLTRIDIHRLSIAINEEGLLHANTEAEIKRRLSNIEKEKQCLEKLRKEYPEYFV